MKKCLEKLAGTKWHGKGELWLDPESNSADVYDCELSINIDSINYSWLYEGEIKTGGFAFNESGANWIDSWHQKKPFSVPTSQRHGGSLL